MLDFGFITLLLEFCAKLRNDGKKIRQNQNQIRFIFHEMLKHSSNLHPLTFAHFLLVALSVLTSEPAHLVQPFVFFWCVQKKREQFVDNSGCACVCVCVSLLAPH